MFYKGLCVIPEGRVNKDFLNQKAEIYRVSTIKNLDTLLNYANTYNLGVMYLSAEFGLLYADDYVTYSKIPIYRYSGIKLVLWSKVVAEQIYRVCLDNFTSEVHLMIRQKVCYRYLIKELNSKGIKVIIPLIKT